MDLPQSPLGKFPIGSQLKHLKTGGYYRVIGLATKDYWIRPQTEMEDGRFELCI
jgi:hypothetical protein